MIHVVAETLEYRFGFELGRRFGLLGALGIILVVYGIPYLIMRVVRGGGGGDKGETRSRHDDDREEATTSGNGPPRFNG